MKPAPSLPALFRARGKRRGFSPGAAARHMSRTRGPQILTFLGVYFWVGYFPPKFFHFFWDRTSFIVRSQIRGKYDLQTGIFGIATPWRRNKTLSDLKKKWKKRRTRDVRFPKKIKPLRNCHPSQRVSTPPGACDKRSPEAAAHHSQSARIHTDIFKNHFFPHFLEMSLSSLSSLSKMRVEPAQPKKWKPRKRGFWHNFGPTYQNQVEPAQPEFSKKKRVEPAQPELWKL